MKVNKYISKRENFLLLTFAFLFFGFIALTFANNSLHSYNPSVSEQFEDSNSYPSNQHRLSYPIETHQIPGLHFFTLFIFIVLLKTKRFLLSTLLTIFYAIVFVYGLSVRFTSIHLGGDEFAPKVNFLDQIYFEANGFDYSAAVLISILLFWQISILLRMLIKTLQRTPELP
jgi:hypothetical protein